MTPPARFTTHSWSKRNRRGRSWLRFREVIEKKGLFCALYSDRGSHFFVTPKAGEPVDKGRLTQVGRAMKDLGVQMIPAYSPQARGRSERNFGTWQGQWRCLEGVVQPVPQIPISKEVQPQHRGQIGERPFGLREMVKPFQQQDSDSGLSKSGCAERFRWCPRSSSP